MGKSRDMKLEDIHAVQSYFCDSTSDASWEQKQDYIVNSVGRIIGLGTSSTLLEECTLTHL
jgi:hypothetical protein